MDFSLEPGCRAVRGWRTLLSRLVGARPCQRLPEPQHVALAIAHRELGGYKGLTAEVACVTKPPMLCVVDGIQFSSQCTLGKGNIAVKEGPTPVVVFRKEGREITIRLPESLRDRIDREMSKESEVEQSLLLFSMPEGKLLEVLERRQG